MLVLYQIRNRNNTVLTLTRTHASVWQGSLMDRQANDASSNSQPNLFHFGSLTRRSALFAAGAAGAAVLSVSSPGRALAALPVFTAEAYAKLEADGLLAREVPTMEGLGARMVAKGGSALSWGRPDTDIALDVVQLKVPTSSRAAWLNALAAERFDQDDRVVHGAFVARDSGASGLRPIATLRSDALTLVSVPDFAKWIAHAG